VGRKTACRVQERTENGKRKRSEGGRSTIRERRAGVLSWAPGSKLERRGRRIDMRDI